jgi:hypothetical protein
MFRKSGEAAASKPAAKKAVKPTGAEKPAAKKGGTRKKAAGRKKVKARG